MKLTAKEIFTVPNILGYIRLALIPVFIYLYWHAKTNIEYYFMIAIVIFSCLTDFFDGRIARKYHQVTELGKLLDPIADKLTQLGLIICVLHRYELMKVLIICFIAKESYMAISGIYSWKKYHVKLDGAKMFGKVCTAILFISMTILLIFIKLPVFWANVIIGINIISVLITLLRYIPVFNEMNRKAKEALNK